MLPRVLEPEVMDTEEEAGDYDAMDHDAVNARFCADLEGAARSVGLELGGARLLDVGTGTALIPVALAERAPGMQVVGLDMAEHMLALAARNVERAGLGASIQVTRADAKALPFPDGAFSFVVANSLVHHSPEPGRVLAEMWRTTARGGLLFVRDLQRPGTVAEIDGLVTSYAGPMPADEPGRARHARQTTLLRASLFAALTLDEVASLVAPLGIPREAVTSTSDRHWTLSARKP